MRANSSDTGALLKAEALRLGFSACGIARAEAVDAETQTRYRAWIATGGAATMNYLERNIEKRLDPTLLEPGARSIISVALNYYPPYVQPAAHPQVAYYAYGEDYHLVLKELLKKLFAYLQELVPSATGRCFVDTAPLLERYWAARSGIGFIGKNGQIILPGKGSYFFLGALITNADLSPDVPQVSRCGDCTRCLDACPGKALSSMAPMQSDRCLSYQTIENQGDLSQQAFQALGNRVYGCDTCQQVCPWNRFALPHHIEAFLPSKTFLSLDEEALSALTPDSFRKLFARSAILRTRFEGLQRNLKAWKRRKERNDPSNAD